MPNKSEVGYADYVLYDDTHPSPGGDRGQENLWTRPRAASRPSCTPTCWNRNGRRPVIFLTNGFDTRIDDGAYPERKVAAFYPSGT